MLTSTRRRLLEGGLALAGAGLVGRHARAQGEPIRIGAVLEFSGGLELFGNQAKLGIDLAASEINAAGGILGRPVEILYEDNKTDPKTSVERATKLIGRDEVLAILGPITSNARDAMAPTMSRQKVPLLYATNYEGGACSRYIFCFNTVPNQELARLVPFLAETKGDSFYMFGADYVWPQKMFEKAEELVEGVDGTVRGKEFTPWGVKEFAPVIRRIQDSGAKVLLFALPGADGITFIRQAEDFGLLDNVTVGFLGFTEAYLGAFGPGKGQDMWVAVPLVSGSDDPDVQDFVRRVRATTAPETPISHYVMTHYNALMATKAALERSGEVEREPLVNGLEGLSINSPTGPVVIGAEDHHVTLDMFLAKTEGDQLVTEQELGPLAPESGCA
jgi:branched-chain amino acid transport system substrate-binding protein/urea transport system substrate-binding protein